MAHWPEGERGAGTLLSDGAWGWRVALPVSQEVNAPSQAVWGCLHTWRPWKWSEAWHLLLFVEKVLHLLCVCVCACIVEHMRSQKITCGSWFSPSTGVKFRLSGLTAKPLHLLSHLIGPAWNFLRTKDIIPFAVLCLSATVVLGLGFGLLQAMLHSLFPSLSVTCCDLLWVHGSHFHKGSLPKHAKLSVPTGGTSWIRTHINWRAVYLSLILHKGIERTWLQTQAMNYSFITCHGTSLLWNL